MLKLNRHFLFSCLLVSGLALAGLAWFMRDLAWQELTRNEFKANEQLSQMLGNSIWPGFHYYIRNTQSISEKDAMQTTTRQRLKIQILRQIEGLEVVKVHLFNVRGMIIFSTDPAQLGADQSDNPGVMKALDGQHHSALTFREQMDAFHKVIRNRNIIASYVPVVIPSTDQIAGVLEVYQDVTPLVNSLESSLQKSIVALCVSLAILYGYLFWIVRRNDRLIQQSRQEIQRLAYHDSLTGLPNRRQLIEELIARLGQKHLYHAVFFIDLDGFKPVNDEHGHKVGDDLLVMTADRLRMHIQPDDLAARIGGDEFVIVISHSDVFDSRIFEEQVMSLAREIRECLDQPFDHAAGVLRVTASIGASLSPHHSSEASDLLRKADMAMYNAKQAGRNQVVMFRPGLCHVERDLSWH